MLTKAPISEHDSWLALDLLWGCANDCGYCFLRGSGLTGALPRLEFPADASLRDQLASALRRCPRDVPVSIGNTTDLFLNPDGRDILYQAARMVAELDPGRLIVMITKAEITEETAKRAADATGGRGLFFLSQSYAAEYDRRVERGPVSSKESTYRSFERIAKTDGLQAIHFWRPFLLRWNPAEALPDRLRDLRNSGCLCSIVIGLKGGPHLIPSYSAELRAWAEPELRLNKLPGEEYVSKDRLAELTALARERHYPLFRNTSCGIAFSQGLPDINGTSASDKRRDYCQGVSCPARQRAVCARDPLLRADGEQLRQRLRRYGADAAPAADPTVFIPEETDEFTYNHLSHVLHKRPCIPKIHPKMAWRETCE